MIDGWSVIDSRVENRFNRQRLNKLKERKKQLRNLTNQTSMYKELTV